MCVFCFIFFARSKRAPPLVTVLTLQPIRRRCCFQPIKSCVRLHKSERSRHRTSFCFEVIMAKFRRVRKPPMHSYNPLTGIPGYIKGEAIANKNSEKPRDAKSMIHDYHMFAWFSRSNRREFLRRVKEKQEKLIRAWRRRQRRSVIRIPLRDGVITPLREYTRRHFRRTIP